MGALLDQLVLSSSTTSQSASKSTSTLISSVPEHLDIDYKSQDDYPFKLSLTSSLISSSLPYQITPSTSITPSHSSNDEVISLPPQSQKKKKKKKSNANKFNIQIHAKRRYKLDDGRIGCCQFIGTTSFGKNKEIWIGLVLENGAEGNINGTIYGKKYFQCRDGKGLFVRPNKIIQELDSAYTCSTRHKKAKKGNDNNVSLSMSVSSPLHINNARFDILSEEDEGIVFMDDNNIRMSTSVSAKYPTHSKSLNVDTQFINKRASMTKSKSAQNVNEKYKHKETDTLLNQNVF